MESQKEITSAVLVVDHDSELASILGAFLTAQGHRSLFTTRVREAARKIANQKFTHIFVDIGLKPESISSLFMELAAPGCLNAQTPITIMASDLEATLPMANVKRVHSILAKPFTLQEFANQIFSADKKRVAPKAT
jgi:DNA-binding response OmpR family regulator